MKVWYSLPRQSGAVGETNARGPTMKNERRQKDDTRVTVCCFVFVGFLLFFVFCFLFFVFFWEEGGGIREKFFLEVLCLCIFLLGFCTHKSSLFLLFFFLFFLTILALCIRKINKIIKSRLSSIKSHT